ncbi:MAG TPA: glycosyltransferase family 39 protein [Opitutaceae bacterium]|nr:glycosyltransferase family 39 protein [Opitutaceae bacterium]
MISPWYYRYAPWWLTALVFFLLVPGTSTLPLIDRDEPRFATATREMIQRHDWIVPTFNGHDRFDKPVLTYWLMRFGYSVFGFTEFGARVHAILATLALVLLTWWVGRRWYGDAVGLWAGAMLASCLQIFIHGRLALADMPMIACVTLSCVALKELLEPAFTSAPASSTPPGAGGDVAAVQAMHTPSAVAAQAAKPFFRNGWWWAFYLSLGFGFLAKGPIVFAVPGLALLLFRFVLWRRHPLPWRNLAILPGLGLTLLIMASWGIPALVVTEGRFWKVGMGEHVVQRGWDRFNGRGYSPFFYLGTAPVSLFPWIAAIGFLPWIARRTWSAQTAWLICWLVAPYLIFTAYATQLPHYVLPAFPALFLLLAQAITLPRTEWPRGARRLAWSVLAIFFVIVVVALIAVRIAILPENIEPLRSPMTGVFLVLIGFVLFATALLRRWPLLGVVAACVLLPGIIAMAKGLRRTSLTAESDGWPQRIVGDARCVGAGFSEPSVVFYSGRQWLFPQNEAELEAVIAAPGPLVVASVLEEADPLKFFVNGVAERFGIKRVTKFSPGSADVARVLSMRTTQAGWESHEVEGFNLGRTRWQRLRIAVRR